MCVCARAHVSCATSSGSCFRALWDMSRVLSLGRPGKSSRGTIWRHAGMRKRGFERGGGHADHAARRGHAAGSLHAADWLECICACAAAAWRAAPRSYCKKGRAPPAPPCSSPVGAAQGMQSSLPGCLLCMVRGRTKKRSAAQSARSGAPHPLHLRKSPTPLHAICRVMRPSTPLKALLPGSHGSLCNLSLPGPPWPPL